MLILTRKVGESIVIDDRITIKVVESKGGQIRLGIQAPPELRILREEIYVKVKEQNQLAAFWDLGDFKKAACLFNHQEKEPQ